MQTVIVAVIVLIAAAVLGRKIWQAIQRRCSTKEKSGGCGKCPGCG
ncbi:MAG TPA: hypothetical protein VM661_11575 [Candidatus Sulfotelmatobacter sp.]|jgi:hypothetical protein|nr:hypothetical protein [Candidatus Sulfotelmatobacter sp.]